VTGVRRFFWGNSLAQAVMSAARHHGVAPEELAYRVHEKRHGFVKHARYVVIEVDPAVPRRPAGEVSPSGTPDAPPPRGAARPGPGPRAERAKGAAEEGGGTSRGGSRRRRPSGSREGSAGEAREVWSEPDEESLLAIAEAVRAVIGLAGLDLEVVVRPGEGRVEVELEGPDVGRVRERGLPLLEELELLAPRAAHGLSGKMVRCRIDCGGLRGDREATLRELARREAEEVGRSGEARFTEPLSPADRRIIHLELAESTEVETESVGTGFEKRVRIAPRGAVT